MISFIQSSDWHYDKETQDQVAKSLDVLLAAGADKQIDFWAFPGDLANRAIAASDAGGLNRLRDYVQRMLDIAPIVAVEGTVTHDHPGFYRVFEDMVGKGGARFFLVTPDRPCFLDAKEGTLGRCMILGCPEPRRAELLAGHEGLSGEAADAVVKEGVRTMLAGIGRIRAEHPELPAVFLYHGQVKGFVTATGELPEGGIEIAAEDLALVGADFIAVGDIHLWQQIGVPVEETPRLGLPFKVTGFPAFYSGDLFPVNWGEKDQKCFNLVQIVDDDEADQITERGTRGVYVTRLPYPYPPRKKVLLTWPETPSAAEYKGFQTWFSIKAPKAEAKQINTAERLEYYLTQGALPGSRVDVDPISEEAKRGAEITQKQTLREEVIYAADCLGKPAPTESILAKADDLEREGRKEGIGVIPRHIRALKLRLDGHHSHQRRLGADEVVLDLTKYQPGIIPLKASNGMGKTALQENFHPFITEFSEGRNGKNLRDNFCLRDSARETWYLETLTGDRYRSLMEIDAVTKDGGVTAQLYRTPEHGAEAALSNGRQADYLEKVQSIFGTESMYVRTGFWMQNPSRKYPRLRWTTDGEKKGTFSEFLGNGHLQVFSKRSGDRRKVEETRAVSETTTADAMQKQADELPSVQVEHVAKVAAADAQRVKVAGVLAKGKTAAAELKVLADRKKAQDMAEAEARSLRDQKAQQDQTVALADEAIAKYTEAAKGRALNDKVVATWDALKAEEAVESGKITKATEERDRRRTAHAAVLKAHNENVRTIEGDKANLRTESARVAGDRKALQADIKHLEEELKNPLNENCPECDQLLPDAKRLTLKERRTAKEKKLADLRSDLVANGKRIYDLDAQVAAIVVPPTPPDPAEDPIDESGLKRVRGALDVIDIEVARNLLRTAADAETRLEETRKQRTAAAAEARRLGDVASKLEATLNANLNAQHEEKVAERERLLAEYNRDNAELSSLQTLVLTLAERITKLEGVATEIAGHREAALKAEAEASDWRYLEFICGPDGIQALKLDALGPSIALEANKLLDVLKDYPTIDNHFDAVEFKTQRAAKDGHQIEDFTIYCHDTSRKLPERMQWVDFAKTSVGEAVWLDLALDFAFGIVRERNQGTRLEVYLQDESDAALDEVSRRAFFEMLKVAHTTSGRWQTVVTTHSSEAQQMFPQCINLEDLVTKPASLAIDEEQAA